jgi:N-acetylmuramoyl-L-alanine amidase
MKQFLVLILLFNTTFLFGQEVPPLYLYGKTQGELPYLEYGRGQDRLGGAKMTYLDTAITMQVLDSAGSRYLVRLSENHDAYIPKSNLKLVYNHVPKEYHLTESWSVSGDANYDYVRIGLGARLPYRSIQQINPSRIVIDIFGAINNTNWITQLRSAKEIKNVYHEQIEDDVFRVFIELKHQQHWGYAISYVNNSLLVRVKRQPDRLKIKDLKIAIDAGHGGSATGAVGSTTGIQEKDYTLIFAKELNKLLKKKGAKTFMTRSEDIEVEMTDRIMALRDEDPNLLISLHLNSSSNKNAKGTSTYYRHIGFRPLTEAILKRMLDLGLNEFGNIGSFNFSLSGPTEYPNCLVEIAFVSNEEDEKRIMDPKFHKQVAKQVYKGINDWLKESK